MKAERSGNFMEQYFQLFYMIEAKIFEIFSMSNKFVFYPVFCIGACIIFLLGLFGAKSKGFMKFVFFVVCFYVCLCFFLYVATRFREGGVF